MKDDLKHFARANAYSLLSIGCSIASIIAKGLYLSRCAEGMQRVARETATGQPVPVGWQSHIPWATADVALGFAIAAWVFCVWALVRKERRLRALAVALAIAATMLLFVMV